MRAMWTLVPVAVLVAACGGADPDGDGLTNALEKEWGTDPKVVDSDGDGVDDGFEVNEMRTHPLWPDTDEDGSLDGDEYDLGLDPLDPRSKEYEGGWPMNPSDLKDAIEAGGDPGTSITVGGLFPRYKFVDQHGDKVDIYDFAQHGKPILVDVSAEWCPPCQQLALWLEGEPNGLGLPAEWTPVRDAVENGDMYWITIMGDGNSGPATPATSKAWHSAYPFEPVPVIADTQQESVRYIGLRGWPSLLLLNEDMEVVAYDPQNWTGAIQAALGEL